MASYKIPPIQAPFNVSLALPGSKSIALRQLLMAALAEGPSTVTGVPVCDDSAAMIDSLQRLGLTVQVHDTTAVVSGSMDRSSDISLDARMSGASTRLLLALVGTRSGRTHIDGHPSLQARTNAPLLEVMTQLGCTIDCPSGGLPATVKGPMQLPRQVHMRGDLSSQYITAMLLVMPSLIDTPTTLVIDGDLVSRPYIDITLNEMSKRQGLAAWTDTQSITVHPGTYTAGEIQVEGDATAATYFTALATVHASTVHLNNLGTATHQGDYGFCAIMQQLGAELEQTPETTELRGPTSLRALAELDMTAMPDAALTLITLAPLLSAPLTLTGLSTLRHKECDRLASPAREFRQMGIQCEEGPDTITIYPADSQSVSAHTLTTYHDHRMAMAFSVLGSKTGNLTVDDAAVVAKTYPHYWQDYARLAAG